MTAQRVEVRAHDFRPVFAPLPLNRIDNRLLLFLRTAEYNRAEFANLVLIAFDVVLTVLQEVAGQHRDVVRQVHPLRVIVLGVVLHDGLFFRE